MNCPDDSAGLELRKVYTLPIAECPQCWGLWFEADQLREAKDEAKPDLNWLDFDLWADQDGFLVAQSPRRCPVCGKDMAIVQYASSRISVDCCVERHGVWLDKGEFEAIIAYLDAEASSKPLGDYAQASLKEALDIIAGDEGFISEWKDLRTVARLLQYRILSENPKLAEALLALESSSPF